MLLSISFGFAQGKPVVTFEKITHDFGMIAEDKGDVSYQFIVKNTGDTPLVINRVSASCGCTTPDWTKEPIAPGKTGFVKATYNPKGRPGAFSKTISVYSNADPAQNTLIIKGEVIPVGKSPEVLFPVEMKNDLRLKQNLLDLGTVTNGESRVNYIEIYNTGTSTMSLSFDKLPKYITANCEPLMIGPNNTGRIAVIFNGAEAKTYGKHTTKFNVIVNNDKKNSTNNTISVVSTLIDDFSNLSKADKDNSPISNYAPAYINFGSTADKGFSGSQFLKISNSGKTSLLIRDISTESDAITISEGKKEVKPNEIVEFKIAVNPKKINSAINSTINIVTNDPKEPEKTVRIVVKP
jgi:hypothetical protein